MSSFVYTMTVMVLNCRPMLITCKSKVNRRNQSLCRFKQLYKPRAFRPRPKALRKQQRHRTCRYSRPFCTLAWKCSHACLAWMLSHVCFIMQAQAVAHAQAQADAHAQAQHLRTPMHR
jgi:hypothetical protein